MAGLKCRRKVYECFSLAPIGRRIFENGSSTSWRTPVSFIMARLVLFPYSFQIRASARLSQLLGGVGKPTPTVPLVSHLTSPYPMASVDLVQKPKAQRVIMGRAVVKFLLILFVMILSTIHQFTILLKVHFLSGPTLGVKHFNVSIVIPYLVSNRTLVLESMKRWVKVGSPCKVDKKGQRVHSSSPVQLVFYANAAVTPEDRKMVNSAVKLLGSSASCFSRIYVIGSELTPEEDIYPAGPSVMFFKVYLDPRLAKQFRTSNHMFWMEHDVQPIRPGWVDALVEEASKGDFWISGSAYLGDGLNDAVSVPDNWNWIGHINGNALYNLRDEAFTEFLRLVVQYEPPTHFWKPFDVSIWRVIHAFPYTWPLYQKYRSKFVYSDFINHWGFHASPADINVSNSKPQVFLSHGATGSAGNLLLRPKPVPPGIIWNDRVPKTARLSIMICSFTVDIEFSYEATMSVIRHVPDALEIVVVVPYPEVPRFQQHFSTASIKAIRILGEKRDFKDPRMQQLWSTLHADKYCQGDLIMHVDADAVLNRELQVRDLMWLNKPVLVYQYYDESTDANNEREKEISHALAAPIPYDFSRSPLRVFPRSLYALARNHIEMVHHTNLSQYLVARLGDSPAQNLNSTLAFNEFDYLGAFAWKHAQHLMSMVPLESDERRKLPLPPPIIQPPVCKGNARLASMQGKLKTLLQSLGEIWRSALPCHRLLKLS